MVPASFRWPGEIMFGPFRVANCNRGDGLKEMVLFKIFLKTLELKSLNLWPFEAQRTLRLEIFVVIFLELLA